MTTLLIATRNAHKVGEIRAILGETFRCLTLNDFPGAPKVIEDAETFAGNAAKKAETLAQWLTVNGTGVAANRPDFVLADDSGLEVDVLNGAPGVHSARFAAMDKNGSENSADADNNAKLLRLLHDVPLPQCTARFRCVMALTPLAGKAGKSATVFFDGACEGKIIREPRGPNGFGYDPLFVPNGHEQTFAELGEDVKNQLSHRAKALAQLRAYFSKLPI